MGDKKGERITTYLFAGQSYGTVTKDDDVMLVLGLSVGESGDGDGMRSIDRSDRDYRGILNTLLQSLPSTAYLDSSFTRRHCIPAIRGDSCPCASISFPTALFEWEEGLTLNPH